MNRDSVFSILASLVGVLVLGTVGYGVFGADVLDLPPLSPLDPGLAELAVATIGFTGLASLVVGVFSWGSKHRLATLSTVPFGVAIVLRPVYAAHPYGDLAWTLLGVMGVLVGGNAALFVTFVEGRRRIARLRRTRRQSRRTP